MKNPSVAPAITANRQLAQQTFFSKVFGWMFFGLMLTAVISAYFASQQDMLKFFNENPMYLFAALGIEWIIVFVMILAIKKISATVATFLFILYAALNGFTMSMIISIYTTGSIASAFAITAGMFGAMALYGYATKKDLSSWGSVLIMALIGFLIASIVNIFFYNETIYWILSGLGIVIFCGLTAYHMNRLKKISHASMSEEQRNKSAIIGALSLYLDFINLFCLILRFVGNAR